MRRFLLLALPMLVLTMALFHFGLEAIGRSPGPPRLSSPNGLPSALPAAPAYSLPPRALLGTWCLEALALTALFLLIQGRAGGWAWANGLLAGWIAWVFRGPLLVLSVAAAGLPPGAWWPAALSWWILYSLCGLLLGLLAQGSGLHP